MMDFCYNDVCLGRRKMFNSKFKFKYLVIDFCYNDGWQENFQFLIQIQVSDDGFLLQ